MPRKMLKIINPRQLLPRGLPTFFMLNPISQRSLRFIYCLSLVFHLLCSGQMLYHTILHPLFAMVLCLHYQWQSSLTFIIYAPFHWLWYINTVFVSTLDTFAAMLWLPCTTKSNSYSSIMITYCVLVNNYLGTLLTEQEYIIHSEINNRQSNKDMASLLKPFQWKSVLRKTFFLAQDLWAPYYSFHFLSIIFQNSIAKNTEPDTSVKSDEFLSNGTYLCLANSAGHTVYPAETSHHLI